MSKEFERMVAGRPYLAGEGDLPRRRQRAGELCFRFNTFSPSQAKERCELLRELFGKVGSGCWIEPPFHCDYGSNILVGENFYANYGLVVLDCAPVSIGNNVFVAPQVGLYTAGHPLDATLRREGWEDAHPISIGDDVWVGGHVVILPGVTIGSGTVIAAGSVVTRDMPEGVLAAGNPCRVLRSIVEEDQEKWLRRIK